MIIRGIPGYFGDIATYEFTPTGTHGKIYNGYDTPDLPQYRCIGIGTTINWYPFFYTDHPDLINYGHDPDDDPIEVLSGIYLKRVTETTHVITLELAFSAELYNALTGATSTVTFQNAKFTLDKDSPYTITGWTMGIAHVDKMYIKQSADPLLNDWDYFPVIGSGLWFFQSANCPMDFIGNESFNRILYTKDGEPPISHTHRVNVLPMINLSTDNSESWYYIGYPSTNRINEAVDQPYNVISKWLHMDIESNQEDDTSGPGGGGGNYGYEPSDPNHYDGIPSVTPASSGFINVYHASVQNLLDMAKFMYTDAFLQNVPKVVSNPIDYIIALMLNAAAPDDGTAESLRIGSVKNVAIQINPIQSVFKTFDCGTVDVEECYGGFLDYAPFTKVRLQLPFCGDIDLDSQIVMHSSVHLRYVVDFLTGSCLARVDVTNNHGIAAETYFKDGNCAIQVPMTGADFSSYYSSVFNAGFGAISAGASALATGNPLALLGSAGGLNMQRQHADTTVTGHMGSNHGFLGNYTPALIISRPVQSFPEGYSMEKGRPSNIGGTLGSFSGYTEIRKIKLDGVIATETELAEIRSLLASGVYV